MNKKKILFLSAQEIKEAISIERAIEKGIITKEHIYAELGQVVLNQFPARENEKEVTFFKSVGNAAQDLTVANLAYESCLKAGIGQELFL